ncbi:Maf-like protein [Chthonobacter rhizosphaerae]|uniref:Maf-like protein n=1 Tax=Chthonobacter rhizosphaerae TaxID=2735553 RepID=UPI0015EF2454|nr:Maf-like protein [Chthonobacter rhizosphaerae]
MSLVLASGSPTRAGLLTQAGLLFERESPDVDERAVEATLADTGVFADDVALVLAEVKATEVSARRPGSLVIGADQTLSLGEERFHKPADMEAARRQLLALRGQTHQLHSAVVVAEDGDVLFRHVSTANLTMRDFTPAFVGHYLAVVGDRALGSVGCYQVEGYGIQLFEAIEGDHFTILGLPLLPLLAFLRTRGVVET